MTVVAGEYYLPGSMESETHLLRLMPVDEEVNVPGPAQLSQLLGLLSPAPEEQIGRAVTLEVSVVQVIFVNNPGVETSHLGRRG